MNKKTKKNLSIVLSIALLFNIVCIPVSAAAAPPSSLALLVNLFSPVESGFILKDFQEYRNDRGAEAITVDVELTKYALKVALDMVDGPDAMKKDGRSWVLLVHEEAGYADCWMVYATGYTWEEFSAEAQKRYPDKIASDRWDTVGVSGCEKDGTKCYAAIFGTLKPLD